MANETASPFEVPPKSEKRAEGAAAELAATVNGLARTVKIIEDKYYNLRKKVQINEENALSQNKKISDEVKIIQSDILEIKRDVDDIKGKIRLIVKELKLTAKSEDIKVVEKYLDLWEPVEFITRNEAKKMIERAIEDKFK